MMDIVITNESILFCGNCGWEGPVSKLLDGLLDASYLQCPCDGFALARRDENGVIELVTPYGHIPGTQPNWEEIQMPLSPVVV